MEKKLHGDRRLNVVLKYDLNLHKSNILCHPVAITEDGSSKTSNNVENNQILFNRNRNYSI